MGINVSVLTVAMRSRTIASPSFRVQPQRFVGLARVSFEFVDETQPRMECTLLLGLPWHRNQPI